MSKQESVRLYTGSDADMRQRMRTMHGHYLTDVAAFSGFNPTLNAAFGAQWLAAIEAADQALPGAVRVGELKEETGQVQDDMEQARQQVQTLFYYVDKAFPKNAGRLEQYGKKRYEKARAKQEEMRTLLEMALQSATRDEQALTTQGYTAAKRQQLAQLSDALTASNTAQKVKKGANKEDSGLYIETQNAAYGYGQQANEAARVLYMSDALKRDLYRLVDAVKRPEAHELTLKPNTARTVLFEAELLPETELRLRLNAGAGVVAVALVPTPEAVPDKPRTFGGPAAADTLTLTAAALGSGQYLWVRTEGPETLLRAELLK
ncbi:hypothetical protein SAMN02745146_1140 [Hymenobacter daecheongensis DSM 21074]|uniref:Uncharacterized protein n=1 Tax=Hymenobacter daecheongensis DSM 21074 TaxID=1121955 RepID=A0A1M6CFR0_9BACT|nr:hypothetical protein [Hymenobacter daecheongensis]SHI59859.1 hypothetical protein SAMN02745146_1140 [Hymenobacter daecheongensis DSM 21074]